jgi:hypothetical protein
MEGAPDWLLFPNEKIAIKSFFCMYLIRPVVTQIISKFRPAFIHHESHFELSAGALAY